MVIRWADRALILGAIAGARTVQNGIACGAGRSVLPKWPRELGHTGNKADWGGVSRWKCVDAGQSECPAGAIRQSYRTWVGRVRRAMFRHRGGGRLGGNRIGSRAMPIEAK